METKDRRPTQSIRKTYKPRTKKKDIETLMDVQESEDDFFNEEDINENDEIDGDIETLMDMQESGDDFFNEEDISENDEIDDEDDEDTL